MYNYLCQPVYYDSSEYCNSLPIPIQLSQRPSWLFALVGTSQSAVPRGPFSIPDCGCSPLHPIAEQMSTILADEGPMILSNDYQTLYDLYEGGDYDD
jgi:hypothetical protein